MKKIALLLMVGSLVLSAFDGAKVYKQCAMCHGKQGEKIALKTSPQLNTMGEDQLATSLNSIIDGSSSVAKKYLKMHQKKLKGVSLDDTEVMANYIAALK